MLLHTLKTVESQDLKHYYASAAGIKVQVELQGAFADA